jgi:hypothetical protein
MTSSQYVCIISLILLGVLALISWEAAGVSAQTGARKRHLLAKPPIPQKTKKVVEQRLRELKDLSNVHKSTWPEKSKRRYKDAKNEMVYL